MNDFEQCLSIIIPTFKPQRYLKQCIDSLRSQSLISPIREIIIVLNGEKDDYLEKILDWVDGWELVSIYYSEIKGVSGARNLGIERAKGSFIMFVDDDDFLSENFIELWIEKLEIQNNKRIYVSNLNTYNDITCELGIDYIGEAFKKCKNIEEFNLVKYRGFLSSVCAKIIPREVIAEIRFEVSVSISEDALFMFSISRNILDIKLLEPDAIYFRRLRIGSAMRISRTIGEKTKIWIFSVINFSKVYFKAPTNYNFFLYLTRLLAVSKVYILNLIKSS